MMIVEHPARQELAALAVEIMATDEISMPEAIEVARRLMPDLLGDIEQDARFRLSRVVMFDRFSARELMEWTERE